MDPKKNVVLKKKLFGSYEIPGPNILNPKKMLDLKNNLSPKEFLGLKKFGPRTFWSTQIMKPKILGPKCLVKIRPVTAEILPIWTNVARAYVAWTNATMTVGIF